MINYKKDLEKVHQQANKGGSSATDLYIAEIVNDFCEGNEIVVTQDEFNSFCATIKTIWLEINDISFNHIEQYLYHYIDIAKNEGLQALQNQMREDSADDAEELFMYY